jgi:(1->4)-alpha-D-glucan 1-alpha-D-glucosylmutase
MLAEVDQGLQIREWTKSWQDGRIKLAIVAALLRCRRQYPDLFGLGSYEPIALEGALSQHLIGFTRRNGSHRCIVIVSRLFARLLGGASSYAGTVWGDMRLDAGPAAETLTNVLTGEAVSTSEGLPLSEILADLPAAVLLGHS